MYFTRNELTTIVEQIGRGGDDSISLFIEVGEHLYQSGGFDALQSWATVATAALPDRDRSKMVVLLMRGLFAAPDCVQCQFAMRGTNQLLN